MGRFILSAFADEYSPELDVQLAMLCEHGFTHIEPRFLLGKNVSALTADEARAVRNKLDAAGLSVSSIGSPLGKIKLSDDINDLKGADVLYSDIWASMGEEELIPQRARLLAPFKVDDALLQSTGNPDVLFMHCLPSFHDLETKLAKEWMDKGVDIREVTDEVFRGRHSVVFDEAENRMHTIKAVMVATL